MAERRVGTVDLLLADRYRLLRPVAHRRHTTLWRAADEVLARTVAVKVLDDPDALEGGTAAFLAAAVEADRLGHPRIASVYDAAVENDLPYVVSEFADGPALADVLRDSALSAPRATTVAAQIAEALVYAHARGVHHGDLAASNVIVCPDGCIKVTDFGIGATVAGRPPAVDPVAADTRAAAGLLYAALTGRSADGADPELPAAPRRDGRLLSPRQVRAGVPREVDAVVVRALLPQASRQPAITNPRELLDALGALPGDAGPAGASRREPAPVPRPPRSRWMRLGVPTATVLGIGLVSLLAGLAVGRVPARNKYPVIESQASGAPRGAPVRPVAVRDFDPDGDGQENPRAVPLAFDGDGSTAWATVTYFGQPAFGGLKPGAGLLVDLGAPVPITRVELAFPVEGLSVEVRAGPAPPQDAAAFPVVAGKADVKRTETFTLATPTTARYWLVWLTRLVPDGKGKFQGGVAEFAFLR